MRISVIRGRVGLMATPFRRRKLTYCRHPSRLRAGGQHASPTQNAAMISSAPQLFVVDDEPGICQFVAAVGTQAGFLSRTAASAKDLLVLLGESLPAVIVLDLNMAETDGVQILAELANRQLAAKIIIFSGSDVRVLESVRQLAEQQGLTIAAILQKPVRKAQLFDIFQRIYQENEPFSVATLRGCLEQNLLSLHFQPKISLATFDVIGCEALLRCRDNAGRPIAPEVVVTTAEESGMIDELSIWTFREAIGHRARWSDLGLDLSVAINLSARSAGNPELPSLFAAICAEKQVAPDSITIELTESAAMDDALVSTETLVRLRLKGFKLSVDDFGTGYSSLLRLKQLPFTEIKIDKSFVANVHGSRDDAAITKAIIHLARSLDLRCVIEGAETQQAIDYAAGLGCDEAQGYFVSKPLANAQLEAFLKTWQWRKNALAARPAEPLSVAQAAGDQSA